MPENCLAYVIEVSRVLPPTDGTNHLVMRMLQRPHAVVDEESLPYLPETVTSTCATSPPAPATTLLTSQHTAEPAHAADQGRRAGGPDRRWPVNTDAQRLGRERAGQDTTHAAGAVGTAPKPPSSVQVLATANDRIAGVPVRRQPSPPGATDEPAEVAVTGTTGTGPVTAVVGLLPGHDRNDVTTS